MLGLLKKLFGGKTEAAPEAPYKVETPVPAADVAPQPVVQVAVEGAGVVEAAPAKKAAPKKKAAPAKKAAPVAKPAPAKKPRKPKA